MGVPDFRCCLHPGFLGQHDPDSLPLPQPLQNTSACASRYASFDPVDQDRVVGDCPGSKVVTTWVRWMIEVAKGVLRLMETLWPFQAQHRRWKDYSPAGLQQLNVWMSPMQVISDLI